MADSTDESRARGRGRGGWPWRLGAGAGGTLGRAARAMQSRVQAGHHRQAAWLAWVPPHLSYLPIHIGLAMAMAWQHDRQARQHGQGTG